MKIVIVFLCLFTIVHSKTLKFLSIDFCPYSCKENSKNMKGYMIDILEAAFKKNNIKIEVTKMPYEKSIKLVDAGRYDGIVIVGKKYAPHLIYPKRSLGVSYVSFVVRSDDNWKYTGIESLKNRVIAIVKDYDYVDEELNLYLKSGAKNIQILSTEGSPTERNLKKLLSNRVDVYLESNVGVQFHINRLGLSNKLKIASLIDKPFYNYTAFSNHNKLSVTYAEMYDKAIAEMTKNGELKVILDNYGIKDWEKGSGE